MAASVSQSYLSELENEKGIRPSYEVVVKIADALDVDPDDLWGRLTPSRVMPDDDPELDLMMYQIRGLTREERRALAAFVDTLKATRPRDEENDPTS